MHIFDETDGRLEITPEGNVGWAVEPSKPITWTQFARLAEGIYDEWVTDVNGDD